MKKVALIMAMVAVCFSAFAQDKSQKKAPLTAEQRIEKQVSRIQESLMLDDKANEKFESIYKDYLKKQHSEFEKMNKKRQDFHKKKADASDSDIKDFQKASMEFDQKMLDLRNEYYDKMSKILNPRQLQKVFFSKTRGGMHKMPRMSKQADCKGNKGKKGCQGGKKGHNFRQGGRHAHGECPMSIEQVKK